MALWQVELIIVPKEKLNNNTNIEDTDISALWNGYEIKKDSIDEIEKVLKRTKSWSEDIVQLGEMSETVIELFYSEDMIEEVTCRLDLRSIDTRILDSILNFININNLSIIVGKKVYVDTKRESFIEAIKESDAYKFIKNPQNFLEEM